jgi:hypothetical protein
MSHTITLTGTPSKMSKVKSVAAGKVDSGGKKK